MQIQNVRHPDRAGGRGRVLKGREEREAFINRVGKS